jgi:hypothetical protein
MRRPIEDRGRSFTISQIISALDDRDVTRAMRLLEPAPESGEGKPNPDRDDAPRCVRCITRGE